MPVQWEAYVDGDMNEAKCNSSGYLPTFEEYLDNGKFIFSYRITIATHRDIGHPPSSSHSAENRLSFEA